MDDNFFTEIISNLQKDMEIRKEDLLLRKIQDFDLLKGFDLKKEYLKRFPKIKGERITKDSRIEETYYYNDGTDDGLRLITFVTNYSANYSFKDVDDNRITALCTFDYF